jgi:hypothetical protein
VLGCLVFLFLAGSVLGLFLYLFSLVFFFRSFAGFFSSQGVCFGFLVGLPMYTSRHFVLSLCI